MEPKKEEIKKGTGSSLKVWAKMLPFLKPYKKNMVLLGSVMVLSAAIDICYTLMTGYAVDHFITPRSHEGLLPFAFLYLLLVLIITCSTMMMGKTGIGLEVRLNRDMREKLFTHLQTLSFSYYNQTPVGTIMARVLSDTSRISEAMAWSIVDVFYSAIYVLGCMVVMLILNWKLALLVIVVVPFIVMLTLYFQKRILAVNRQARKINAEITRHYNEGISGAKTSKTLVIEDKNTAAFQEVTGRMKSTTIRAVMLSAVYVPLIGLCTALAVSFVITGGGAMVLNSFITDRKSVV